MRDLIGRLLDSWSSEGAIDKNLFDEDFIYMGPSKMMSAKVWLNMDNSLPVANVKIIGAVVEENNGVLLFECDDEFTQLRYRYCWYLKSSGDKIINLIEIKEIIER
jgi:hypothetical protein